MMVLHIWNGKGKSKSDIEAHQVTQDLHKQLSKFRATHSYKYLDVGGDCWRYVFNGKGEKVLLMLPGAPGVCEMAFQQIMFLEHTYRILSVIYPSTATTVIQIIIGLQAILARENVRQIHVVGGSFGGAIAQCLLLHMPHEVEKLILTCTGAPDEKKVRMCKMCCKFLSLLPLKCIHTIIRWGKLLFLSDFKEQRSFWNVYFDQVIASLSKEDYLTRIRVWIDFHQNYTFFHDENFHQSKKVLIVEAEKDIIFPIEEQKVLEALYPQAQIYTFLQATHVSMMSRVDEYLNVITHFLREPAVEHERNANSC